jgi:hypothetical protein
LAGFLRFLLIWQVLVDITWLWTPHEVFLLSPKSCTSSWSDSRDRSLDFGGVDPRVLFIPSCPGYTGLTGALDRSDRCEPFVGFASGELLNPCVFWSCCCWSVLGCFGGVLLGFVKGSSSLQVVFLRVFWFQGLEKSLRLSGTFVMRLLQPPA